MKRMIRIRTAISRGQPIAVTRGRAIAVTSTASTVTPIVETPVVIPATRSARQERTNTTATGELGRAGDVIALTGYAVRRCVARGASNSPFVGAAPASATRGRRFSSRKATPIVTNITARKTTIDIVF